MRAVQKTGESTRDLWHKTDWNKVKEDPESIGFPREEWIHQFDAEKYAEETYEDVRKALVDPVVGRAGPAVDARVAQTTVTVVAS